jgi:hypothetical protein
MKQLDNVDIRSTQLVDINGYQDPKTSVVGFVILIKKNNYALFVCSVVNALMQPEWLDDDIICTNDASKPGDQLKAVEGGVVGKLDSIAAVALKNLQGKTVVTRVGDHDAVALAQAQVVAHLVCSAAQDDGDHVQVLAGIGFSGWEGVWRHDDTRLAGWGWGPNLLGVKP